MTFPTLIADCVEAVMAVPIIVNAAKFVEKIGDLIGDFC